MENYQLYGAEWEKEVYKIPYAILEKQWKVKKLRRHKNKGEYIQELRSVLIRKRFNLKYPIGSKIEWFSHPGAKPQLLTVSVAAWIMHGTVVAKFDEKSAVLAVEPGHIDY